MIARVVGAATLAAMLALGLGTQASGQGLFSRTQDPVAGSRVFGAKGCVKCHAVNGVGGREGPDLGRVARPRSFHDLAAAMWNHLPRMAARMRQLGIARPYLDETDTGNLIAFLFTLDYFDPPGNVEAGRRLVVEKKCTVCHQVAGAGGVVGPDLELVGRYASPIFVATAMWNHGPSMAEAMRARGITRPVFTGSELRDLIAYVRAAASGPAEEPLTLLPGRADEGRRIFVEKRCVVCHPAGDRVGGPGPDLAERGLHRSLTDFAAAMWNKAPAMLEAMKARGLTLPELRAEEMADLVGYLYSVRYLADRGDPGRGRARTLDKGCLGCHSLFGSAGPRAGALARAKGVDSPAGIVAALWNHTFVDEPQKGPWPEVRAGDMADLIAFLQTLRRSR